MTKTTNTPDIRTEIDSAFRYLTFVFSDGERVSVWLNELSADILAQATAHGLKQKIGDAGAISRDPATGRTASVSVKRAAMVEVIERLRRGEWNKGRDGAASATGGLLYRALCRMYAGKKDADAIREFLDAKTDAEKAALRKNAKVAAIIEEIRAESAKPGDVNTDDLLADLEG